MAVKPTYFGKLLPHNEAAVLAFAEALRLAIVNAPHNSIISLMVKIDANGNVDTGSSMDTRQFPLRAIDSRDIVPPM